MIALAIYEDSLCKSCGRPMDVCRDPEAIVVAEPEVCMYERAVVVEQHRDQTKNEKAQRVLGEGFWSDGLRYVPRLATSEEIADALRRRRLPT